MGAMFIGLRNNRYGNGLGTEPSVESDHISSDLQSEVTVCYTISPILLDDMEQVED